MVDEKTGTVVLGGSVRLTKVAVAHGNLQIVVAETPQVSQPGPFSQGQTVTTPQTNVKVKEQNNRLLLMWNNFRAETKIIAMLRIRS